MVGESVSKKQLGMLGIVPNLSFKMNIGNIIMIKFCCYWNIPFATPNSPETPTPQTCTHKCQFGKYYQHDKTQDCPGTCKCKDCCEIRERKGRIK